MKVGLFGGSFNPVHKGHIRFAEACIAHIGLDRLLLIPAAVPPHKEQNDAPSPDHRKAMCELAAAHHERIQVSDIEIRRGGKSYTVDTLEALKKEYPKADFFLLVGSDMFFTMHTWKSFRRILTLCELCTAERENGIIEKLEAYAKWIETKYRAKCHVYRFPVLELSSTEIRAVLRKSGDVSEFLDPKVYAYIRKNRLYQNSCRFYNASSHQ